MNHRLPGIISPLGHITTDPIRFSVKPPSPVYCKTTIKHLKSLTGIEISPGLTNQEISAVEYSLGFSFPLDLRSILQYGVPVGTHFPDWRSGSTRNNNDNLLLSFNLPLLHLSELVSRKGFWVNSWGTRTGNESEDLLIVKKLLEFAPVLVPIYGNFYVPSTTPNLAGNPVFQIDGDGVRILSCDVAGFLQGLNPSGNPVFQIESSTGRRRRRRSCKRRVEFWSDVAEKGIMMVAREDTRGWWSALSCEKLRTCLDEAFWKLRDAGWTEDEVRDMMMMDGVDRDACPQEAFGNGLCGEEIKKRDQVLSSVEEETVEEEEEENQIVNSEVTTLRHLLYSHEA